MSLLAALWDVACGVLSGAITLGRCDFCCEISVRVRTRASPFDRVTPEGAAPYKLCMDCGDEYRAAVRSEKEMEAIQRRVMRRIRELQEKGDH